MSSFSKTFQALSDETRRKILDLLHQDDLTPTEIGWEFGLTAATISHHLKILREADLISCRRKGQRLYYSLNLSVFEEIVDLLYKYLNK